MTLQATGTISLGDIAAEFGGFTPHSLSDYYGVDPLVPGSGTIRISDFYSTSIENIALADDFVDATDPIPPYNAVASFTFTTDGLVNQFNQGGTALSQYWAGQQITDIGDEYNVRAFLITGTAPTGPALGGVWHSLSTARTWTITRTVPGVSGCNLTIQIGDDQPTPNVLATASFTITAETGSL